jgi:uncharacterized RDD family membrane protein YckC
MQRFDEIELEPVPLIEDVPAATATQHAPDDAPRFRRLLAFLTDVSLFVALTLALSPLLPVSKNSGALMALGGFVLMTSYYYFVGTWLLWGKTIGGAIFDVKVVTSAGSAMSLSRATLRWLGLYLSLLIGGAGFLLALLPSRYSLSDRMSGTRCITAV